MQLQYTIEFITSKLSEHFREQEQEIENSLPWLQQQSQPEVGGQNLVLNPFKLDVYQVLEY